MILGGTGGMCRTGAGGSIPGWRETFLHAIAIGDTDFTAEKTVQYSASVRIKDTLGTWITINAVTAFSTNNGEDGNATASVVIADVSTWGTKSVNHNGLLSPSERQLEITVTMVARGISASSVVFAGSVTNYLENISRGADSISLTCKAMMQRISETGQKDVVSADKTKYRETIAQGAAFGIPGPFILFEEDQEQESTFSYYKFPQLPKILYYWSTAVSAFAGGVLIQRKNNIAQAAAASLTDSNIVSESRATSEAEFNTVRCLAHGSGVYVSSEITDAADVALRGKIYAPKTLYSYEATIAEVEAEAALSIADQLLGKITAQVRFNPLLMPGSTVYFTSARMGVDGTGTVSALTHSYSAGNASTTLTLRVVLST